MRVYGAAMRLVDLEPRFIRYNPRMEEVDIITGPAETWRDHGCPSHKEMREVEYKCFVESLGEAQGILFQCACAQCKAKNGMVEVTFADRGVLDRLGTHNKKGEPTRWNIASGTDFSNLSLTPSILIEGGCNWHGFVTNGEVT
jgi:hypothetical protein